MDDKFTVYRQQPTPKAIAKIKSGEYTKWGGLSGKVGSRLYPTEHTGRWWTPRPSDTMHYDAGLYKNGKPVNKITEILKGKININQWIKGWKESVIEAQRSLDGTKPTKADLAWIDREAKVIKNLYKTNKKKFLSSMVYASEALLDNVDDVRTSVGQTWKVNKPRAVQQAAKYVGKGVLSSVLKAAPPIEFLAFPKEMGDAELPFPTKENGGVVSGNERQMLSQALKGSQTAEEERLLRQRMKQGYNRKQ
tara:strand:- start:263 stop:1012 length:750 start_codon:yes stop_codon:yes gene_type:complete